MVRDSNLVEQAMQLADDGVDLLRQVAGIHVESTVRQNKERKLMQVGNALGLR